MEFFQCFNFCGNEFIGRVPTLPNGPAQPLLHTLGLGAIVFFCRICRVWDDCGSNTIFFCSRQVEWQLFGRFSTDVCLSFTTWCPMVEKNIIASFAPMSPRSSPSCWDASIRFDLHWEDWESSFHSLLQLWYRREVRLLPPSLFLVSLPRHRFDLVSSCFWKRPWVIF